MTATRAVDLLVAILLVAIVYVLVRPRSQGVTLVNAISGVVNALVEAAADLGGQQP